MVEEEESSLFVVITDADNILIGDSKNLMILIDVVKIVQATFTSIETDPASVPPHPLLNLVLHVPQSDHGRWERAGALLKPWDDGTFGLTL